MQWESCSHSDALDLEQLRRIAIDIVRRQTSKQLAICQIGQRLSAGGTFVGLYTRPERHKVPLKDKCRERNGSGQSAKVLDDIKLDRDLKAVRGIYDLTSEARGPSSEGVESAELGEAEESPKHAALCAAIEALRANERKEEKLTKELLQNQATLRTLKAQYESEQHQGELRLAQLDERLDTLGQDKQNLKLLSKLEFRLVQKWEENRYTQAEIFGSNAERKLQAQIDQLQRLTLREQRTICEVENFNSKHFEELLGRIANWQRKYAADLTEKNAELEAKELRAIKLQKQHERLREVYEGRVAFVRDYLEVKAEQERQLQLEQHRVESAVRIQAWWRGVMVRRGLGPFKRKKKGKKGKAKSK